MDNQVKSTENKARFNVVKLEQRIAPAQAASPLGQFPAGNPAQTEGAGNQPGNSFKGGK